MPELLSIAEAAAALGVTSQTIYHQIKKGRIEVRKVDGRHMVTRASLSAYSPLGSLRSSEGS